MSNAQITLIGNMTRDPEMRFTPGGFATASFGVAVSHVRNDKKSNEKIEETSFFNIKLLGSLAENAAQSLMKGMRVVVVGRLEQRAWETQEGEKRTMVEVIADEVSPSLRWATCSVDRNERREASSGSGGGGYRDRGAPAHEEEPFVTGAEPWHL